MKDTIKIFDEFMATATEEQRKAVSSYMDYQYYCGKMDAEKTLQKKLLSECCGERIHSDWFEMQVTDVDTKEVTVERFFKELCTKCNQPITL